MKNLQTNIYLALFSDFEYLVPSQSYKIFIRISSEKTYCMGLEVGGGGTEEEEEKEEKFPLCESIGHRPLWGRCPAPHSTLSTTYSGRARVPLTI